MADRFVITIVVDDEEIVVDVSKNGRFYDEAILDARDIDEFVDYLKELAYKIITGR